jgi:hypothetical protein
MMALRRLNKALKKGETNAISKAREGLEVILREIDSLNLLTEQIIKITPDQQPQEVIAKSVKSRMYCMASMTIAEAYAYLTQRLAIKNSEPEWMLAVSGLKHGDLYTLENLVEVRLSSQSVAQASFDMKDFTRIAVALYDHGQALHAIFHSHRFKGPPQPSGIDHNLQRILDEGGYPAIQAVFSEDGYVRFFAHKEFSIEIYGKGVVPLEHQTHLYRIVQFSTLPHPPYST